MNTRKARAIIALGASSTELDKDIAAARKKLKGFAKGAKNIGGKLFGAAKAVGGAMLGGFGIEAAGGILGLASDVFDLEKNLTRFQIASGKSNEEMAKMRQSVLDVSKATGVGSADVLAGAQTYVDLTGDVKGAEAAMSSFARIAQASGSSVGDIATATAALQQSMKLDPKDIETAFSGLIMQGKAGAVSLKDFAGELSSLAPRFSKFAGGNGLYGIKHLGAAFQVARQGFGSASEAATGLEALMGSITQNASKFEAAGVKIFKKNKDGSKSLRDFADIIEAIGHSKLMKDPTRLAKAFGSKEAAQTFDMLNKNVDTYDELIRSAGDANAVQRDLDTYQQSAAGKLEKAFAAVKVAIAEAFTPERIAMFADALVKVLDLAVDIVKAISSAGEALDVEGMAANTITRREVGNAQNLTSEQKRARAEEFVKKAAAIKGDDMQANAVRQGYMQTADELRKRADDWYQGPAQFGDENANTFNPIMFQQAMIAALTKAPIVVKMDNNGVATAVANAPVHRQPKRGR